MHAVLPIYKCFLENALFHLLKWYIVSSIMHNYSMNNSASIILNISCIYTTNYIDIKDIISRWNLKTFSNSFGDTETKLK